MVMSVISTSRLVTVACRPVGVLAVLALSAVISGTPALAKSVGPPARPAAARRTVIANGMTASRQVAQIIETTQDLSHALTTMPSQAFTATPAPGASVIKVDASIHYQTMMGFGAAMTDSSAWLLYDELTPQARAATMAALFSPQGIDLNYVRIPMAASDYTVSPNPYTYDDMPPGETDPTMANFSIAHDEPYVIPALRQMLAVNPGIFTLANPWTAPPWMKQNQAYNDELLAGVVNPQYYPALAQYFADFIRDYELQGVSIDAITPMNQPNANSSWPGTNLTAADDATFLPDYLVPALGAAGEHPMIFGDDDTELADAQALLSGPAAADLSGIAFHCYKGMTQLSTLHDQYPAEPIIVNECSPGIIPYATAEVPIDAARNWASGVQLWNLALDPNGRPYEGTQSWGCPGCTGVVTVNEQTGQASLNRNYYQFGQTTKYVQRWATRIFSTRLVSDGYGISRGVDDVAFQNPDGTKVLVAYNNAATATTVAIDWQGRYLSYRLAPAATVTFTWK
jgi:glucosylceramidase